MFNRKRAERAYAITVFLAVAGMGYLDPAYAQTPTGPTQFTNHPLLMPTSGMVGVEVKGGHVVFVPPVAGENAESAGQRPPPSSLQRPHGGGGGGGGGSGDFGTVGAVAVGTACPGWGPSINDDDATCAPSSYQGEPMLAASPGLASLAGSQNDIYPGACNASATPGTSGDCGPSASVYPTSGTSWQRYKLSRNWGGHNYLLGYDGSVAVDSTGRYFIAYGVSDGSSAAANGLVVVGSANGSSWTKAKAVVLNSSGGNFEDKPWIAADATPSQYKDRLYVAWDRNQGNNQILLVSYSADQGQSWSAPQKINDGTSSFERVIYAFPAVVPDGSGAVYVLWHDYARNKIFIDKSTNGGVTWGTDMVVASTNTGFGVDIGCNGKRSMTPAPQMAINADGRIYVTFANNVASSGVQLAVFITMSPDGGAHWSAPQRVSTTNMHQYNPAVTLDGSGHVKVSYLDRRADLSNCSTNTYLSSATLPDPTIGAGGSVTAAFNFADTLVSSASSDFDLNPNGPGDYQGIAALQSPSPSVFPYFSDHRAGDFEIYAGRLGQ